MSATPLLQSTWDELRRRKVVRAAATYAVVAWIVLQLGEITFEPLGLPGWVMTWTVLAAVLGFPVVMVLAWYFDFGSRGVEVDHSRAGGPGRVFALIVVLLTVAALAAWLATVYRPGTTVASGDPAQTAAATTAPANSIAVLAFDDMSPGADQAALAEGIAEELLDRLAKADGLRVAARTSSFALSAQELDIKEIGRLLNVRWVLEGSVRKAEGRLRITAQLIDAADGYHVWSETYERTDADLFALQDAVTDAIAGELSKRIGKVAVDAVPTAEAGSGNSAALQHYLEGRQAWRQRTPAGFERAEQAFQQALQLDPQLARAWSGLADTYLLQGDYGVRSLAEAVRLAEPAAVRAVSLAPTLGEAWASVGLLRMTAGQTSAAKRSLLEAIELDPRYEMAPMWLARVYADEGDQQRQEEVLRQALQLSPLEPVVNSNLATLRAGLGDVDGARAMLEKVLAITPDDELLLRSLADVEKSSGKLDAALAAARRAYALDPAAPANIESLARVYMQLEAWEQATALVAQLPSAHTDRAQLLQYIELRRNTGELHPALVEQLHALTDMAAPLTPADRESLLLAGFGRVQAGADEEAATLLRRALGEPEAVQQDGFLLDAGSLLELALRRAGHAEEAARWMTALTAAAQRRLEPAGGGNDVEYARAAYALRNGQRDAALQHLQRAYDNGFRERWRLRYDPRLQELADDPAVVALYDRMGAEFAEVRRKGGL